VGIVVIIVGLALSIGLHEFGHLIPAKLFGVRVPNWAIGFGPKLFSKKIGETEYSLRLIPLGGFVTLIGMFPPDRKGKDSTRRFGRLIAQSRSAHSEHMQPGDEGVRTLYSLAAWKRIVVMFGGPLVNLILGLGILTYVFSSVGVMTQTTTVGKVETCVAQMTGGDCTATSEATPASIAGVQDKDRVVAMDGIKVGSYAQLQKLLQASNQPIRLTVKRDSKTLDLKLPVTYATLPYVDANGNQSTHRVRIMGIAFTTASHPGGLGVGFKAATDSLGSTFKMVATFPQQVYKTIASTVEGQKRDPNGAVSVVGVAQASASVNNFNYWLYLLGSLNIALFVFNMIPLPPLDGGHIAGGIYEYLKRGLFRLFGRKDPGPVDTALLAPFSQVMFFVLLVAGVLVMFADLVNPIRF